MQKPELTERQHEILDFIRDQITNLQRSPTVREIGRHFDIKSPNGVLCHVKALEKKGYLKRDLKISRGISLTERREFSIDCQEEPEPGKEYTIRDDSGNVVGTIRRLP